MTPRTALVLLSFLSLLFSACSGSTPSRTRAANDATTLPTAAGRADPGYIQYLERQSMLGSQVELARIVSGSQLAWQRQAAEPDPKGLLRLSNSWLHVHPLTVLPESKRSVFNQLASAALWQNLGKSGIRGLYVAPTGGAGAIWAYGRNATMSGEDIIQYHFSETAGDDGEYRRMLTSANMNRGILGTDLVPASTGLGPDFFLATRNLRSFPGIYCMVEIPQNLWPELPPAPSQWRGEALSPAQLSSLAAKGILPGGIRQDGLAFGRRGGWAVTGEIHGVDGLARRWAYRYDGSPDRPILNWEDPSSAARRVFSGSAIQQVGLLGNALVGLRLSALYGLEAASPGTAPVPAYEPAIDAAHSLSREVRRYGGWTWLRDEAPLPVLRRILAGGPDFALDSVTSPGAEHAMLTGDATLLRTMLDEALRQGLDMRRLAHAMPGPDGISYALPHLAELGARHGVPSESRLTPQAALELRGRAQTAMAAMAEKTQTETPKGKSIAPVKDETLYTTSAGLMAMALGAGSPDAVEKDMTPEIMKGHLLLAFFKALQPGLFVLSGQDLAGTLSLSWQSMVDAPQKWDVSLSSRGAYSLADSSVSVMVTGQGMARAKTVYPSFGVQTQDPASFISRMGRMLALRDRLNVAQGRLYGRFLTNNSGTVALAILLPSSSGAPAVAAPQSGVAAAPANARFLAASNGSGNEKQSSKPEDIRERTRQARDLLGGRIVEAAALDSSLGGDSVTGDSALILICNFSRAATTENIDLTASPLLSRLASQGAPVLVTESGTSKQNWGQHFSLTLQPWEGAAVLIGKEAR